MELRSAPRPLPLDSVGGGAATAAAGGGGGGGGALAGAVNCGDGGGGAARLVSRTGVAATDDDNENGEPTIDIGVLGDMASASAPTLSRFFTVTLARRLSEIFWCFRKSIARDGPPLAHTARNVLHLRRQRHL